MRDVYDSSQEESIKAQLRERMKNSKQMILLVGNNTKYLRKFVPWEVQLARKKNIPIIVVNLNNKRSFDEKLCPLWVLKDNITTVHVSFKSKIIKHAMNNFPNEYNQNNRDGAKRYYRDSVYESLGLI